MPDLYQIIERPLITEKALELNGQRKYAFVVHPDANKFQIREAVEALLTDPEGNKVTVTGVNTIVTRGKAKRFRAFGRVSVGRTATVKKAIVTLAEGQSLQIFEGV